VLHLSLSYSEESLAALPPLEVERRDGKTRLNLTHWLASYQNREASNQFLPVQTENRPRSALCDDNRVSCEAAEKLSGDIGSLAGCSGFDGRLPDTDQLCFGVLSILSRSGIVLQLVHWKALRHSCCCNERDSKPIHLIRACVRGNSLLECGDLVRPVFHLNDYGCSTQKTL
jgi:hypothetical protein